MLLRTPAFRPRQEQPAPPHATLFRPGLKIRIVGGPSSSPSFVILAARSLCFPHGRLSLLAALPLLAHSGESTADRYLSTCAGPSAGAQDLRASTPTFTLRLDGCTTGMPLPQRPAEPGCAGHTPADR